MVAMSRSRIVALRVRRNQRGASIFVVMSVLMVLTAAGVFATHVAGLNQRMSGYAKQATLSTYIADMGTMAVVDELSNGSASAYMHLVLAGTDDCQANPPEVVPGDRHPCYRLTKRDIEQRMASEVGAASRLFDASGLSTPLSPLTADFVVEMTDPGESIKPIAGMDQSGVGPRFRYLQLTFSGVGQARPSDDLLIDQPIGRMATVRANRAVVQVGPLPY